jgi:hypothetical protein
MKIYLMMTFLPCKRQVKRLMLKIMQMEMVGGSMQMLVAEPLSLAFW